VHHIGLLAVATCYCWKLTLYHNWSRPFLQRQCSPGAGLQLSLCCRRLQDLIAGINNWQRPAGATALHVRMALEKEFNHVQGVVQRFTSEEW